MLFVFVSDIFYFLFGSVGVAEHSTVYSTPQVSYGSTAVDLSDKESYPFFARTCLPDSYQGDGLADLLFELNLTVVSVVSTDGAYSSSLAESFINA